MKTTEELQEVMNDMVNSNTLDQDFKDSVLQMWDFYQQSKQLDRLPRGLSAFVPSN
jgi:hypothetical protein